jgi:DNA-binding FrmR family transcriptional regulator
MQHEHDARQLAALRDEVDRVARLLLDDSAAASVNQAA